MKLRIENIGKISEAEIYLNGVTVIGGINNTGKSTVCKSLFALCDAFHNLGDDIHLERVIAVAGAISNTIGKKLLFPSPIRFFMKEAEDILNCSNREDILSILREIPKKIRERFIGGMPENYRKAIEKTIEETHNNNYKETLDKIERVFEIEDIELVTSIVRNSVNAEFLGQVSCMLNEIEGKLTLSDNGNEVSVFITHDEEQEIQIDNPLFHTEKAIYIDNAVSMSEDSRENFYRPPSINRKYGHKNVLKEDLQRSPGEDNLVENLLAREKLSAIMKKVNQISRGLLIRDKEGIWRYRINNEGKPFMLNVENVSAGVLAFAILRRIIENGTLQESGILILDEPETHLHPEWQNIFAEILILLCKDFDFKILLNTHSHYFLTAIETLSEKYKIADKCSYYLSYEDNNMANIIEVTDNIEKIYQILWQPIQDMENLKDNEE